jgi:hypothetical protein
VVNINQATIFWQKSKIPFTRVFIELTLRALVEIHNRYLAYSYDQFADKEPDFSKINKGLGIAYAEELSVCAAIKQEFISSRYTSNIYFRNNRQANIKRGKRNWEIELNPRYNDSETVRADLYIERTDRGGKGTIPTMIEAKRAFLHTSGSRNAPENQIHKIEKDIQKLRTKCGNRLRGYILVWNITTADNQEPYEYFNNLKVKKPDIIIRQVRQVPLYVCETPKIQTKVKINRWLWVVLGEVTPLHPEKGDVIPHNYSFS